MRVDKIPGTSVKSRRLLAGLCVLCWNAILIRTRTGGEYTERRRAFSRAPPAPPIFRYGGQWYMPFNYRR